MKTFKYSDITQHESGFTTITFSSKKPKYDDWLTEEIIEWVWKIRNEKSAVFNLDKIMIQYEKRKSFKQKFKALFR